MIAARSIDAVAEHSAGCRFADSAPQLCNRREATGDILLTHAYFLSLTRVERRCIQPYAPLGPLFLAGYLRQQGYRVRLYDTTFQKNIDCFSRYIEQHRPELVAISVLETTRRHAMTMIDMCRRQGIQTIVGGPDPSADPEPYLGRATHVVVGEGEETMSELLAALSSGTAVARDIAGVYRGNGTFTPRRPLQDLGVLPFPARDMVDYRPYFNAWKKWHGMTSIQLTASRGCPLPCSLESDPVFGAPSRLRPARVVAEEMLFIKMIYGPDRLWFTDNEFGTDTGWLDDFRRAVAQLRARVPFECACRADAVNAPMLWQLKTSGCCRIWLGVASGSPKVLGSLGVRFSVDDVSRARALAADAGIEAGYNLVLGHPSEAIADVELTRQFVRQTRPDCCRVTVARPRKGTSLYRDVEQALLPVWYDDQAEDERILTFRSRYSQNFYDAACNLISHESSMYSRPRVPLADRLKHGMYRIGYGIMKNGMT